MSFVFWFWCSRKIFSEQVFPSLKDMDRKNICGCCFFGNFFYLSSTNWFVWKTLLNNIALLVMFMYIACIPSSWEIFQGLLFDSASPRRKISLSLKIWFYHTLKITQWGKLQYEEKIVSHFQHKLQNKNEQWTGQSKLICLVKIKILNEVFAVIGVFQK